MAGPVIEVFSGDRQDLMPLFLLAEDSHEQLAAYMALGDVLVARGKAAFLATPR